jgi:hypothetical protein
MSSREGSKFPHARPASKYIALRCVPLEIPGPKSKRAHDGGSERIPHAFKRRFTIDAPPRSQGSEHNVSRARINESILCRARSDLGVISFDENAVSPLWNLDALHCHRLSSPNARIPKRPPTASPFYPGKTPSPYSPTRPWQHLLQVSSLPSRRHMPRSSPTTPSIPDHEPLRQRLTSAGSLRPFMPCPSLKFFDFET